MTDLDQKIVSSEDELLILVDADDNDTGHLSKAGCHDGDGVLHRAFSVFLFNDGGELLLQQRGAEKRLWPMFWSNSCCSHPRKGESMEIATRRRLQDELNIDAALEFIYKFSYQASFGVAGSENELCWVYLGRLGENAIAVANETEIEALRYISADDLSREFREKPEHFTPWFRLEWQRLCSEHTEALSAFTSER